MLKALGQFLTILLLIAFGYFLYQYAVTSNNNAAKVFHVGSDGTVTLIGKVISNQSSCSGTSNAKQCILLVRVGTQDVSVIYGTNDNSFCANEAATGVGRNTKIGAQVKVFGFYQENKGVHTVLTCPASAYTIEVLP